MGFLDHSTNNIIVDAVLTAEGRAKLAAGNLVISSYSFFDTEVDYTIIKKYGVAVGKEKIEKNTAILEASTSTGAYRTGLFTDTDGDGASDVEVSGPVLSVITEDGFNITIKNNTDSSLEFNLEFDTSLINSNVGGTTVGSNNSSSVSFTVVNEEWSTAVVKVTRVDIGTSYFVNLTKAS